MGAWDELDTDVIVNIEDLSELDELINYTNGKEYYADINEFIRKIKAGLEVGAEYGAQTVAYKGKSMQERLIAQQSQRSGALMGSIEVEQHDRFQYTFGTTIEHFYPLCIENGRGEVHPINYGYIQWQNPDGSWVRLNEPRFAGPAAAKPFVQPTYEQLRNEAEEIVWRNIINATK